MNREYPTAIDDIQNLKEVKKDYELFGPCGVSMGSFSQYKDALRYRRLLEKRIGHKVSIREPCDGKDVPKSYPPVLTKHGFVKRYSRGEFGNRAPTWETYKEWDQDHYKPSGPFHIRNRIAGGATYYNISYDNVRHDWFDLVDSGHDPADLYISAMAPHEVTLIQGEILQTHLGIDLLYTQEPYPMREALAISQHRVTGIIAVCLLQFYMCPNSWEWLQILLDRYPSHVVEFSTFEREWGTLPGFNTVWWEVRRY